MPKNSKKKCYRYMSMPKDFIFDRNNEKNHKDYQEFINLLQLMNNLKRPEQITRVERILTKQ